MVRSFPQAETRNRVKKITLAVLLALSAFAWAKENPNLADYTINVHVSASRTASGGVHNAWQRLNVLIDGKKYELESGFPNELLALGDYKARLIKDEHPTTYDSFQVYEFLFPDQKTRKFTVVGQTE